MAFHIPLIKVVHSNLGFMATVLTILRDRNLILTNFTTLLKSCFEIQIIKKKHLYVCFSKSQFKIVTALVMKAYILHNK